MTKRKAICILLAVMQLLALSGCGGNSSVSADKETSSVSNRAEEDDDSSDADDDGEESEDDKTDQDGEDGEDSKDGKDSKDSKDGDSSLYEDSDAASGSDKTDSSGSSRSESSSSQSAANKGTKADYDAAYETLDQLMIAMKNRNTSEIIKKSNLGIYTQMLELFGDEEEVTQEELLEELLDDLLGLSKTAITSYKIGTGAERPDLVQEYQNYLTDMKDSIDTLYEGETDTEGYDVYLAMMELYPDFQMMYVFPVAVTEDGDESASYMYVTNDGSGWRVDLMFVSGLIGYEQKTKVTFANISAKTIYNAANTAVVDMDYEDLRLDLLAGNTYYFEGSDFQDVTAPSATGTEAELLQSLRYRIAQYTDDAANTERIGIAFEPGGACCAVAVQNGTMLSMTTEQGETPVFGSYPMMTAYDEAGSSKTLETVLANAAYTD